MCRSTLRPARASATLASMVVLTGLAAACSPTVVTHGYQLDERRLTQIQPGVTSREEVARVLGTPSSTATFDDRNWYYIQQRYERANFFRQNLVAQDIVAIGFDERGIVSSLDKRDMTTAQAVQPDPEETATSGNELNVLEQFVGNIGRFNRDGQDTGLRGQPRGPGGP